jgi:hypothetical protein
MFEGVLPILKIYVETPTLKPLDARIAPREAVSALLNVK